MFTHPWDIVAAMIAAMSALVGAPLTAILFYLRALRDEQRTRQHAIDKQLRQFECEVRSVEQTVDDVQRSYTTKEAWIRETMLARKQLERLSELMARIQAELEQSRGLGTQFLRATNAIIDLTEHLAGALKNG
ncbi:MAG: hypothetical protein V3T70_00790 [Phycisphaerae bacterium]